MKIQSQNIYGGNQQFADNINNHNHNLSDNDRKIVELVKAEGVTDKDREALIRSLETVKSQKTTEEEKNKSKSFLKTLLEASVSVATKEGIKAILTQGYEYANFKDLFI